MEIVKFIEDQGQFYWQHKTEVNDFSAMGLLAKHYSGYKLSIVMSYKPKKVCVDDHVLDKIKTRTTDNWLIILN